MLISLEDLASPSLTADNLFILQDKTDANVSSSMRSALGLPLSCGPPALCNLFYSVFY